MDKVYTKLMCIRFILVFLKKEEPNHKKKEICRFHSKNNKSLKKQYCPYILGSDMFAIQFGKAFKGQICNQLAVFFFYNDAVDSPKALILRHFMHFLSNLIM